MVFARACALKAAARCFSAAARASEQDCVLDLLNNAERQRFQRWARLNDPLQYRQVFERAIRSSDRAFTVLARENSCGYARLGLAISRKCAARAVARNRIKRLVRESFRLAQHELTALDIVVTCKPVVNTMTNQEVAAALQAHWECLKEQCKNS